MKQFRKGILSIVCTLALLYTLVIPAQAADTMFYDCVLYLFGFNDVPEVVTQSVAIQVQAADGSDGVWAVASVQVTQGATQYIAADPSDSGSNAYAELIASDPDSGIAVFRLDGQITSRSAPTIQTLDGLSAGDSVAVAGISPENDSLYYFSRGAYLQSLQSQSGYSFLALQDGSSPHSELVIYPIGAVMTDTDTVIGFYLGSYIALPAGYIMPDADGIGTLGSGDTGTDDGGEAEPPPETGDFSPDTVLSDTGIDDLLQQAEAERRRSDILRVALIAGAVAVAAGLILFALLWSRKKRARIPQASGSEPVPQPDIMGKTEYVGAQDYGKTEPALPQYRIIPLEGTQGAPRDIPPQGLTFGRSPDCDVTFPPDTSGVSGKHCSLRWRDGSLFLTDLNSSFGTLLEDGRKLSGEGTSVTDGTRFYLGSHKVGFRIEKI